MRVLITGAGGPGVAPVGDDAAMILGVRAQLDDPTFESTMRATLGLTW